MKYESYLSTLLKRVYPHHVVAVDDAPEKYPDLVQQVNLTVYAGNSEHSIYGSAQDNHRFRAWHDSIHLGYGLSFTDEQEYQVARIHASQFGQYSTIAAELVYADITESIQYFNRYGEFPSNPQPIIESCVKGLQ